MNPPPEVLDRDADNRQRQEGIHRQPGADREHKRQRACGEHDRVRRVHNGRTQQHAHRIQIIGRTSHNVAGARTLVEGIGKLFQMLEKIVAQIKFDLTGNTNEDPTR